MNYYEHHIGDYLKDTAHLSMIEDAAYRRLIDVYYTRETPLPTDRKAAQKLARAQSKEERAAVDYVLDEFFELREDGWYRSRCDEEIGKERKKQAALKDLRERDEYRRFRDFVLDRDGHTCVYCRTSAGPLQLDHVIPRSRGGADTPDNLVACCKPCNTSKGPRTPQEWRAKNG